MNKISQVDLNNYKLIRENVSRFTELLSQKYDNHNLLVLDIAPQVHDGCVKFFKKSTVKVLDIDVDSNADYILDLCETNTEQIPDESFDMVICTEVLEHVNNPFLAVNEMYRIVKKGGIVATTTPFNFRIHNPLPDNWRFTEHGLRTLFSKFKNVTIESLEDDERFLMPIHYTLIAEK